MAQPQEEEEEQQQQQQQQHMKGWQISRAGNIEETLHLVSDLPRPSSLQPGEVLVRVACAAINPADYKVPEGGAVVARAVLKMPKTVGMDLSGWVVGVGADAGESGVKEGDTVMGRVDPKKQAGSLSEYVVLGREGFAVVATGDEEDQKKKKKKKDEKKGSGVTLDQAAGAPTVALTAYQVLKDKVKAGDKVFINGGSGGAGTFAIQIAKVLGCHVTTTCSTSKAPLCRELGADEIVDYKTTDVAGYLSGKSAGQAYNLFVDIAGSLPSSVLGATDKFLVPGGRYVLVGASPSLGSAAFMARGMLLPGFLGGSRRGFEAYLTRNSRADLEQVAAWLAEGQVRTVLEEGGPFGFEDVVDAFRKLKGGSCAGKVVVRVAEE